MSDFKKYVKKKVKAILKAIKDKPVDEINVGVNIQPCKECKYYLRCNECSYRAMVEEDYQGIKEDCMTIERE